MHGIRTQTIGKLTSRLCSSLTSFFCFSGPHGAKYDCQKCQNARLYTPRTQRRVTLFQVPSFPGNDSNWPNFIKCPPQTNQTQLEVGAEVKKYGQAVGQTISQVSTTPPNSLVSKENTWSEQTISNVLMIVAIIYKVF